MVCNLDDPDQLAFPLRRGLVWRRLASELRTEGAGQDLLPGIASLFNGALFRAATVEAVGVPDLRLFVRGDEVELHRRLVRSGLPFGTCLDAIYLHPCGTDEFKPILGGRMHTQYPDNAGQEVLHLPQPGLSAVPAGITQAAAAGVVAVRLVLPGVPPRPAGSRRVGSAAQAGQARKVREAMTFTDAAAQSRTMTRARRDLVDGFARRELWAHLGWQDIKQRYRRSVLGPFWITIATGVTAIAMGGLYSKLFKLELSEHLPYVTLGLIIWNLINAAILEGADVFVANEGLIKQLPTPLSVHVYRLVWRQMILFAHNIVIFVVIAIIFPKPWSWADLTVIPALGLIVLNCVWVSLCFGILSTRYRDISPLLFSLVQLLFFMTPIIWNESTLEKQGAGQVGQDRRAQPAAALPRHRPGAAARCAAGAAALGGGGGADVIGWIFAAIAMRQYRARVPYWV